MPQHYEVIDKYDNPFGNLDFKKSFRVHGDFKNIMTCTTFHLPNKNVEYSYEWIGIRAVYKIHCL